jgi:hypothetical protein
MPCAGDIVVERGDFRRYIPISGFRSMTGRSE